MRSLKFFLEFEPLGESILQDEEGEAVARLCV